PGRAADSRSKRPFPAKADRITDLGPFPVLRLPEGVLPWVPVRQWVLTVPHRLRYRLAFDHAQCRAAVGVFVRAVPGWYRRRARRAGWADGHAGSVTGVHSSEARR